MKIIIKLFVILVLSFGIFNTNIEAGFFADLFDGGTPAIHIDCGELDCNLQTGIELVQGEVNGIESERSLSEYIQDITAYILTFISIIAVIFIIYTGFRILLSAGDEETVKKQKMTILYVVFGILLIWLAYPIVAFIMNILNSETI